MLTLIDSKMSQEQQELAKKVLVELNVGGFQVHFDSNAKSLVFEKDRRVVSVPVRLIEKSQWADIRFLFRAILGSENSLWNRSAEDNDWSGRYHYD